MAEKIDTAGIAAREFERVKREWLNQAQANAEKYADALGMSKNEYIGQLPKFKPQPPEYKGWFSIPLIVQVPVPEKGFDLREMLELNRVELDKDLEVDDITDWSRDPQGFSSPTVTYVTWVGKEIVVEKRAKPSTVRNGLAPQARGGTIFDALALHVRDSKMIRLRPVHCVGSEIGSGTAPIIYESDGRLVLQRSWTKNDGPEANFIIAGRKLAPDSVGR